SRTFFWKSTENRCVRGGDFSGGAGYSPLQKKRARRTVRRGTVRRASSGSTFQSSKVPGSLASEPGTGNLEPGTSCSYQKYVGRDIDRVSEVGAVVPPVRERIEEGGWISAVDVGGVA